MVELGRDSVSKLAPFINSFNSQPSSNSDKGNVATWPHMSSYWLGFSLELKKCYSRVRI